MTLDAMGDAIHVIDRDQRLVLINAAFRRWCQDLGLEMDEPIGRTVRELFPFVPAEMEEEYRRVFASGTVLVTHESSNVRGKMVFTETRKIPVIDGGRVIRVVTVIRDFTRSVQDEEERRRLEEQLRQSQKMEALGRLAGGLAHDFNNLLSPILGMSSMMLSGPGGPSPSVEGIEVIQQAAVRARELVQQLLFIGRGQTMQLAPLDLRDVVGSFANLLRKTIRNDIHLEFRLPPVLWRVNADPRRIEQVLLNLALNAQEAMPNGGTLTVALSDSRSGATVSAAQPDVPAERWVCLSVADTGVGMDQQTLARVFEPFFSTKRPGMGTGLGLSIVYGLVKQHGGHIQVVSAPGRGSTFHVYLPRLVEPADQHEPGTGNSARGS